MLLATTAQGVVRFDADGEIMAGLARRWDVSDDGLYYVFRLSGRQSEAVARRLRAAAQARANPLRPVMGAIREIVAVTPEVVELRLIAPRPYLFQLLAQPELAMVGVSPSGPMRSDHGLLRAPMPAEGAPPAPVRLGPMRAALAVARFRAGRSDLVLGGSFADLAIARAASLPPERLRFDPVEGLFGLGIARPAGVLASADGRRAVALAIDRARIVALLDAPGQQVRSTILPSARDEAELASRRATARTIVAGLGPAAARPIRAAWPTGPGASLLFALVRQDLAAVGLTLVRTASGAPADLRLVDRVAPADDGVWQLRQFTCDASPVCSAEADEALAAARAAPTLAERARHLAEAAAALDSITPFIPIATPVRWSLVAPSLDWFATNRRGAHPLDRLRGDTR